MLRSVCVSGCFSAIVTLLVDTFSIVTPIPGLMSIATDNATDTATAVVTVDKNGKITDVNLDTTYTKDGVETTKKKLGDAYGMYGVEYGSKVGEWYTQVEALEKNVVDNQGLDKVKLDSDGYTDSVSGCTIKIDALYEALDNALKQAKK